MPQPIRFALAAFLVLTVTAHPAAQAQGTQADYDRANGLRELTRHRVFRDKVKPHWSADGNRFWYQVTTAPEQSEFVFVDAQAGTRTAAFDHARFAELLSEELGDKVESGRLPVERLEFRDAAHELTLITKSGRWLVNRESGEITRLSDDDPASETGRPNNSAERPEPRRQRRDDNNAGQRSPDGQ